MYLRLRRVKIHVTFFFAAALAFALNSENAARVGAVFAGALLHECAHLALLLSYGCTGLTLTLRPGGAVISGAGAEMLPPQKLLVAVLAGPAVNLTLAGALALCARRWRAGPLYYAAGVNLLLGAANLLPLGFLDGGRALACLRAVKGKDVPPRAAAAADILTLVFLCALTAAAALAGRDPLFSAMFTAYCAVGAWRGRRAPAQ